MRCANCPKEATITLTYTKNQYCEKHLYQLLLKRIRHDMKTQISISKGDRFFIDTKTPQGVFLKQVMNELFGEHILLTDDLADRTLRSDLLEEDVTRRFLAFLQGTSVNNYVMPMRCICVEEFNSLTGCTFSQAELLHPLLLSLLKHRPGSVFAIHNSLISHQSKNENK
jgi:hypothetical protein